MQLRDYQLQMVQQVNDAWGAGYQNVLGQLSTGGGKSVIIAALLEQHTGCSIVIAHRKELVSQLSLTLAGFGIQHNIIAPRENIREIIATHHIAHQRSYYATQAAVTVASVDTLIRLPVSTNLFKRVSLFIVDECFVSGTLIDGKPIEHIKTGDTVRAFNEKTGDLEYRKVLRVFKNIKPKHMASITFKSHHVLNCTYGHPFYTKRGWIDAKDLKENDVLLYLLPSRNRKNYRVSTLPIPKRKKNILFKQMRVFIPRKKQKTACKGNSRASNSSLYYLWERFRLIETQIPFLEKDKKSVLRKSMFGCFLFSGVFGNYVKNQQKICIRTDENKQPYAIPRNTEQSVSNFKKNRVETANSRRERKTYDTTREPNGLTFNGDGLRLQFTHTHEGVLGAENTGRLQTRFCQPLFKTRYRNRRIHPFREKKSARYEKRPLFKWVRVDSITFYESRGEHGFKPSRPEDYVYNFEVEGLHTYIANGIVTHNCHHVLRSNKWGRACALFPNARGFLPTATPVRADGGGLGRHAQGLADTIVTGPTMRELITAGHLCDYRIFAPPNDLDLSTVNVTASGDFSPAPLRTAVHKSRITGDIVEHYLKIAPGKRGVTFAVDLKSAAEIALEFKRNGVAAEVISSQTPPVLRQRLMQRFRAGELLQLVNVDILGEGVDVPAIEVVSMGRPTESYCVYAQQFGRALRPLAGKQNALIIDHVNNYARHGLPDAPRVWSLDARTRTARSTPEDVIPLKTCIKCLSVFTRFSRDCPYCGHYSPPVNRSAPQFVDGDLCELDAETLATLRGEAERIVTEAPKYPRGVEPYVIRGIQNRHAEKIRVQHELRDTIAQWAGYYKHAGCSDSEIYRRFYLAFGIDVLSAQALATTEATVLKSRIIDSKDNK